MNKKTVTPFRISAYRERLVNNSKPAYLALLAMATSVPLIGAGAVAIGSALTPGWMALRPQGLGAVMLLLGLAQAGVGCWMMGRSSWSVFYLMTGAIYGVGGKLIHDADAAALSTTVVVFFVLIGVDRLTCAAVLKGRRRARTAWQGGATLLIGAALAVRGPALGATAVLLSLGIEMVVNGIVLERDSLVGARIPSGPKREPAGL